MTNEYYIESIHDLAKIPDEAVGRFVEEMPNIIKYLKNLDRIKQAYSVLGVDSQKNGVTWIDDGEQNQTIKINFKEKL